MSKQLLKSKSLKTKLEEWILHASLCAYNRRYALDKSYCISKAGIIAINRTIEDVVKYLLNHRILYEKFFSIARLGISNIKSARTLHPKSFSIDIDEQKDANTFINLFATTIPDGFAAKNPTQGKSSFFITHGGSL